MAMQIPLSSPEITNLEKEAVLAVLDSSRLSLGPQMEAFEATMATYLGVPHAVAVSSGTAGLHLCLLALGIGPGHEVIVPSFTFIAAANAIRYVGATPVFVDIVASTMNMDPVAVEAALTSRTRALMVVHTFGYPANLDALQSLAQAHHLLVIEDACEALGSEWRDQRVGSFGDCGVFAFYPNKQITTGEGGMIVTRSPELARTMKALRNQGRYESDHWLQHSELGYNYRLSELSCALGLAQLSRIDSILQRREAVAAAYSQQLGEDPAVLLPPQPRAGLRISWFVYVVRLQTADEDRRNRILARMADRGIQCGRYFAPIHRQPAYLRSNSALSLPITEAESVRALALPFFTTLNQEQIRYITAALRDCLGEL